MKTDIFVPEKIKVGFQNRGDTYTGKLAFVTYIDEKGKLRKEKSWNGWRSKNIAPLEVENVPTSGFVLNKKAGGYSTGWNHRQTYVRIYDPRGFEFEITIQNLLYILENTNSIKGKGLDGEFIYGWSGTEILVIPTSSPDYKEITEYNKKIHSKEHIKSKELIFGATYKTRQNQTLIYLGRFNCYNEYSGKSQGKKYFFRDITNPNYSNFYTLSSLGDKIISVESETPVDNYATLMQRLEKSKIYSPHDPKKDEVVSYAFEEFEKKMNLRQYEFSCFTDKKELIKIRKNNYRQRYEVYNKNSYDTLMSGTLEDIYAKIKPSYIKHYLENGELYATGMQYH